jgi:hypothetical protein
MRKLAPFIAAAITALLIATYAAAGPGLGISKTAPLSGTGSSGSPLKLTLCTANQVYAMNAGATAFECTAPGGSYTAGDGLTLTASDFDVTYTSDFQISTDQLDLSTAVTAPGTLTTAGGLTAGDTTADAHTINGSVTIIGSTASGSDGNLNVRGSSDATGRVVARLSSDVSGAASRLQFTDGFTYNYGIGTAATSGDLVFSAGNSLGAAGTERFRVAQNGETTVTTGATSVAAAIAGTAVTLTAADAASDYLTFRGTVAKGLVFNNSTQAADGYLLYDQTARSLTFAVEGAIKATIGAATTALGNALTVSGNTTLGDAAGDILDVNGDLSKFGGTADGYVYFKDNTVGFQYATSSDGAPGYINYYGYQGGFSEYRNLIIGDGRGATVATITGSTKALVLNGPATLGDDVTDAHTINGGVTITAGLTVSSSAVLFNTGFTAASNATFGLKIYDSGSAAAITTCGTPTATGGSNAITFTAGNATTCTVTFAAAWTATPICIAQATTSKVLYVSAASTTALTIAATDGSSLNTVPIKVLCMGDS